MNRYLRLGNLILGLSLCLPLAIIATIVPASSTESAQRDIDIVACTAVPNGSGLAALVTNSIRVSYVSKAHKAIRLIQFKVDNGGSIRFATDPGMRSPKDVVEHDIFLDSGTIRARIANNCSVQYVLFNDGSALGSKIANETPSASTSSQYEVPYFCSQKYFSEEGSTIRAHIEQKSWNIVVSDAKNLSVRASVCYDTLSGAPPNDRARYLLVKAQYAMDACFGNLAENDRLSAAEFGGIAARALELYSQVSVSRPPEDQVVFDRLSARNQDLLEQTRQKK